MRLRFTIDQLTHAHMREIYYRRRMSKKNNSFGDLYIEVMLEFARRNPTLTLDDVFQRVHQLPTDTTRIVVDLRTSKGFLKPSNSGIFEVAARWFIDQPENYLGQTFYETIAKRVVLV